jgi:hypothetical protein
MNPVKVKMLDGINGESQNSSQEKPDINTQKNSNWRRLFHNAQVA